MDKTTRTIKYVDRPELPESYVNHVRLANFEAGVVRIEICVDRLEEAAPGKEVILRYPAVRLAMAAPVAVDLQNKIAQIVARAQQQVLKPSKQ